MYLLKKLKVPAKVPRVNKSGYNYNLSYRKAPPETKHRKNRPVETPEGVLGIPSDGDGRMEPKVKTQKNP